MDEKEMKLKILLEEYSIVRKSIEDRTSKNEKVLTIGFTLLSAFFTFGFVNNIKEVFYLIPALILLLFAYITYIYSEVFTIAGYVVHLEKEINLLSDFYCLIYETKIAPILYYKFINWPMQLLVYLIGGSGVYISFIKISTCYPNFFLIYLFTFLVFFILIFISNLLMFKYREKAIQNAEKKNNIKKRQNK